MSELKRCVKCGKLPEDILTLTCGHDLCLDCASQRLAYELSKNASANSVVCQICYERTIIDQRSVSELKRIIANKQSPEKMSRIQKNERLERVAATVNQDKWRSNRTSDLSPSRVYNYNSQINNSSPNMQFGSSISGKKICNEHPEEEILYFCFNCLCECICPECVIHGKHKEHDVKTIRKAHPIVKGELEANLEKIEGNIENLQTRKSQIDQNVRSMSEQNTQAKVQIQRSFEQVRALLLAKQKQILAKCDDFRSGSIDDIQKVMKTIMNRIEQLRGRSGAINQYLKKDELTLLNFYAKKGKLLDQQFKEGPIKVSPAFSISVEKILLSIRQLASDINRISSTAELRQR